MHYSNCPCPKIKELRTERMEQFCFYPNRFGWHNHLVTHSGVVEISAAGAPPAVALREESADRLHDVQIDLLEILQADRLHDVQINLLDILQADRSGYICRDQTGGRKRLGLNILQPVT